MYLWLFVLAFQTPGSLQVRSPVILHLYLSRIIFMISQIHVSDLWGLQPIVHLELDCTTHRSPTRLLYFEAGRGGVDRPVWRSAGQFPSNAGLPQCLLAPGSGPLRARTEGRAGAGVKWTLGSSSHHPCLSLRINSHLPQYNRNIFSLRSFSNNWHNFMWTFCAQPIMPGTLLTLIPLTIILCFSQLKKQAQRIYPRPCNWELSSTWFQRPSSFG